MRILFVISCLSYGGAEKNLIIVANHLSKNNEVAICNFKEFDTKQLPLECVSVYDMPRYTARGKFGWIGLRNAQYKFLRQTTKTYKPDVIISFLNMPNLMAVICGKRLNVPVIISERADPYQAVSKIDRLSHYIYNKADGAVFQTDGAKAFYAENLQKKSVVISNPVILPENLPQHNYYNSKKEIVFVGRFEIKQKRQDLALQAMKLVHERHPEYKIVFWGDGADQKKCEQLAEELGLQDCVVFAGVTKNVIQDIMDSELFLLTSDYEGIPNSLIEAMSIGIPCVSTDCSPGGAKMLLGNGKYGILVERNSAEKIAQAIIQLIEDKKYSKKLGIAAKESMTRFLYDKVMEKWDVYIRKYENG